MRHILALAADSGQPAAWVPRSLRQLFGRLDAPPKRVEHATDLVDLVGELLLVVSAHVPEVLGAEQQVVRLAQGALGDVEEPRKVLG